MICIILNNYPYWLRNWQRTECDTAISISVIGREIKIKIKKQIIIMTIIIIATFSAGKGVMTY